MRGDKKIPHFSQRMNILGRKRYSGDANAKDVIDFSFDDCWRAISWLWFLFMVLTAIVFQNQLKLRLDKVVDLFDTHTNVDII